MAFERHTLDSETAHQDFLALLNTFALANGWTQIYGPPSDANYWQFGLSKGNCHISIGLRLSTAAWGSSAPNSRVERTNVIDGTNETDRIWVMSLMTSNPNNANNPRYWGNPGQSTSENSGQLPNSNDLVGPFPNVWFFTNATGDYIHWCYQRGDRFVSGSFGNLDNRGLTTPPCAYACGNYYVWWQNNKSINQYSYGPSNLYYASHDLFMFRDYSKQVMIPDGVLDPVYKLGETPGVFPYNKLLPILDRGVPDLNDTELMNFYFKINNTRLTGGVPLHSIPMILGENNEPCCFLGEIPDIRLISMDGIADGSEITYGSDTWICFPFRKSGAWENTVYGKQPTKDVNSWKFGIAIRKIP